MTSASDEAQGRTMNSGFFACSTAVACSKMLPTFEAGHDHAIAMREELCDGFDFDNLRRMTSPGLRGFWKNDFACSSQRAVMRGTFGIIARHRQHGLHVHAGQVSLGGADC